MQEFNEQVIPHEVPKTSPTVRRRLFKALIPVLAVVAGLTSGGGLGALVALSLLGFWLFLDIQDSAVITP